MNENITQQVNNTDSGSFGWAVLGFFFPLIGLILYFVWKSNKPNNAKKAGNGALIGLLLSIIFYVIIWPTIQASIVDQVCKSYGENYSSIKKDNIWYCQNPETGELIDIR